MIAARSSKTKPYAKLLVAIVTVVVIMVVRVAVAVVHCDNRLVCDEPASVDRGTRIRSTVYTLLRWIRKDAKVAGLPLHQLWYWYSNFWSIESGVSPSNSLLFLVCVSLGSRNELGIFRAWGLWLSS